MPSAAASIRGRRLQVTASELAAANSAEKCWLQIDSDAYDVTSYAPMHPDGASSIYKQCGKEITSKFYKVGAHSAALLALTVNVGRVVADPVSVPATTGAPATTGTPATTAVQSTPGVSITASVPAVTNGATTTIAGSTGGSMTYNSWSSESSESSESSDDRKK